MRKVYALADPAEPDRVCHIGVAEDPGRAVATRNRMPLDVAHWLNRLDGPPLIRILEETDGAGSEAYRLRMRWISRIRPQPCYLDLASESPPLAPAIREPDYEDEVVTVPVPPATVTNAIRMRTQLLTLDCIAERLTTLGQPPGHLWTPGEVRHLIAQAFYQ